ncbi:hypothetical protein C5E05_04780 [Pseudoclavibacter sp. AY1H1]|nr:hypothetical protein C5E05_04780 [Pseudoclavibacter sp. AY1H1]
MIVIVVGALIAAFSAGRRSRSEWLRKEQLRAYEDFFGEAHRIIELAISELGTDHAKGERRSFAEHDRDTRIAAKAGFELQQAALLLSLLGDKRTARSAQDFANLFPYGFARLVQLPGLDPYHAKNAQLFTYARWQERIYASEMQARRNLGLSNWLAARRSAPALADQKRELELLRAGRPQPILGSQLVPWGAVTWGGHAPSSESSFLNAGRPWQQELAGSDYTDVPVVAIACKIFGEPWMVGIGSELDGDTIEIIRSEVAHLIENNGTSINHRIRDALGTNVLVGDQQMRVWVWTQPDVDAHWARERTTGNLSSAPIYWQRRASMSATRSENDMKLIEKIRAARSDRMDRPRACAYAANGPCPSTVTLRESKAAGHEGYCSTVHRDEDMHDIQTFAGI